MKQLETRNSELITSLLWFYKEIGIEMFIPDSKFNECYLVSKNFDVILDWNRSNYFALTVFLFSDEIK